MGGVARKRTGFQQERMLDLGGFDGWMCFFVVFVFFCFGIGYVNGDGMIRFWHNLYGVFNMRLLGSLGFLEGMGGGWNFVKDYGWHV